MLDEGSVRIEVPVYHPCESNGSIQYESRHRRPSSIKSLIVTPRRGFARLRIRSIPSKISLRSTSSCAGTICAASFPRLVIPIRSPREARSTSSESFCLASNSPTLRITAPHTPTYDQPRLSFYMIQGRRPSPPTYRLGFPY